MAFWDEIKDKAAWAAEQVGEKLEEATEAGKTEFQALKVKRQIDHIDDEVGDLQRKLGRRAFELWTDGKITDEELSGFGKEIEAKKAKIAELEKEIEGIRAQLDEFRKEKSKQGERRAEAAEERRVDEEEGIDGEAIWEDDEDDGTPPAP